jgi:hypothetical protein
MSCLHGCRVWDLAAVVLDVGDRLLSISSWTTCVYKLQVSVALSPHAVKQLSVHVDDYV